MFNIDIENIDLEKTYDLIVLGLAANSERKYLIL